MRGESMKDKSKKSTYSTTFGVDPKSSNFGTANTPHQKNRTANNKKSFFNDTMVEVLTII